MITWTPIAQLPDELKDGRPVLIAHGRTMAVAEWCKSAAEEDYNDSVGWRDVGDMGWGGTVGLEPTHFAEITPP